MIAPEDFNADKYLPMMAEARQAFFIDIGYLQDIFRTIKRNPTVRDVALPEVDVS